MKHLKTFENTNNENGIKMDYIILNWMDGSRIKFENEIEAKEEFSRMKIHSIENNEEFDMSCFKLIEEFNNID